jgi:hypothetical protein
MGHKRPGLKLENCGWESRSKQVPSYCLEIVRKRKTWCERVAFAAQLVPK